MFHYNKKNVFTLFSFFCYLTFIVWRNESSLYQIQTFYQKSHIPDAIFFIKDNKEYFQNIFSHHSFFSNFVFYKNVKSIIDLHYNFNNFTFMHKFTSFFIKEKHLSNIIRDTKSHEIYKEIFHPSQYNSKKTLSDIIQLKPLLQTKIKTDIQLYLSNNVKNQFNIHDLFEIKPIDSSKIIYCQQLHQISNDIANEFDKQSNETKESFLHFLLSNLQRKDYHRHFFGFILQLDTMKILTSGYYLTNTIESIKIELISKINILLYLYKNSQNKMEYLMKQIIMETTFLLGLFTDYIYFLFWAFSIFVLCMIHTYRIFFKNENIKQSLLPLPIESKKYSKMKLRNKLKQ